MSDRLFSHEVWLSKLREHLTEQRYAARTSRQCIAVACHFLRCLDRQHVNVSAAQPANVEEYLRQARRTYRRRHHHPPDYKGWRCLHTNGIHMLLRLVQGQWPPPPRAVTPAEIGVHNKMLGTDKHKVVDSASTARNGVSRDNFDDSLSAAKNLTTQILGGSAKTFPAQTQSGIYKGTIIAET